MRKKVNESGMELERFTQAMNAQFVEKTKYLEIRKRPYSSPLPSPQRGENGKYEIFCNLLFSL